MEERTKKLIDELMRSNEELRAENAKLLALNLALQEEIKDLKRRLSLNSSNSSKPASSDHR
jgi:regulator of replication initiation timing